MIVVLITCPDLPSAETLTRSVLEKKLAACAHILPQGRSLYWWQGQLEESNEHQVWFKSQNRLYKALEAEILRLHPFEVPQILSMNIQDAFPAYERWVQETTEKAVSS